MKNKVATYFLRVLICCGFFVIIQTMPKTLAIKGTSDVKEYMIGEQKTRRRQNFVQQVAMEKELFDNVVDTGPKYDAWSETDEKKETLPGFVVDYANMIRNDIILLDKSVETRTRKRDNIQVEKHNQLIPDAPCSCDAEKEKIPLGNDHYPTEVVQRNCNEEICRFPYKCIPKTYQVTILKKRTNEKEESLNIPYNIGRRWIAFKIDVITNCVCTKDYVMEN